MMQTLIHLHGKIVFITGAARGIGYAIADAAMRSGADVVIADLDGEAAEEAAHRLRHAHGHRSLAVEMDVSRLEEVEHAVATTLEHFGRIDVLVNNAGWDRFAFFLETTPDFWEKVIAINYKGVLNCCYAILPHMVERQTGAIVNIASDAGRVGSIGEAVYAGCKAGIIGFSKTLAREHARDNIRVNVVAPGLTATNLLAAMSEERRGARIMQAIAKSIPLGRRPAEPEEIAPAVVFLASDAARFMTGQVLSVSGGLTMVD